MQVASTIASAFGIGGILHPVCEVTSWQITSGCPHTSHSVLHHGPSLPSVVAIKICWHGQLETRERIGRRKATGFNELQ
jgi:hypothetical protein